MKYKEPIFYNPNTKKEYGEEPNCRNCLTMIFLLIKLVKLGAFPVMLMAPAL